MIRIVWGIYYAFSYGIYFGRIKWNCKTKFRRAEEVQVGNINDDIETLLKSWFINQSDENYPKDDLHIYTKEAIKRNKVVAGCIQKKLITRFAIIR